jgi:hypothetical protein
VRAIRFAPFIVKTCWFSNSSRCWRSSTRAALLHAQHLATNAFADRVLRRQQHRPAMLRQQQHHGMSCPRFDGTLCAQPSSSRTDRAIDNV